MPAIPAAFVAKGRPAKEIPQSIRPSPENAGRMSIDGDLFQTVLAKIIEPAGSDASTAPEDAGEAPHGRRRKPLMEISRPESTGKMSATGRIRASTEDGSMSQPGPEETAAGGILFPRIELLPPPSSLAPPGSAESRQEDLLCHTARRDWMSTEEGAGSATGPEQTEAGGIIFPPTEMLPTRIPLGPPGSVGSRQANLFRHASTETVAASFDAGSGHLIQEPSSSEREQLTISRAAEGQSRSTGISDSLASEAPAKTTTAAVVASLRPDLGGPDRIGMIDGPGQSPRVPLAVLARAAHLDPPRSSPLLQIARQIAASLLGSPPPFDPPKAAAEVTPVQSVQRVSVMSQDHSSDSDGLRPAKPLRAARSPDVAQREVREWSPTSAAAVAAHGADFATSNAPLSQLAVRPPEPTPMIAGDAELRSGPAPIPPAGPPVRIVKVLQIRLEPAELGTLTATLRIRGDEFELRIEAADAKTADMLRQSRRALSDLLRSAGCAVESDRIEIETVLPLGQHLASPPPDAARIGAAAPFYQAAAFQEGRGSPQDRPPQGRQTVGHTSESPSQDPPGQISGTRSGIYV